MAEKNKCLLGTKGGKLSQVKHSDSKKDVRQQTKLKASKFSLPSIPVNENPSETSLTSITELFRHLPKSSKTSKSPAAVGKLSSNTSKPSKSSDTPETLPNKPSKNSLTPESTRKITSQSPETHRKASLNRVNAGQSTEAGRNVSLNRVNAGQSTAASRNVSLNRVNAGQSTEAVRKVSLNRKNAGQSPEAVRKGSLNRVNTSQSSEALRKVSLNRVNTSQSPEARRKISLNRVNAGQSPDALRKVPLNQVNTSQSPEIVRKAPLDRTNEILPPVTVRKFESENLHTEKADSQTTKVSLTPNLKGTYSSKISQSHESPSEVALQTEEPSMSSELPKDISRIQQSFTSVSDISAEIWNIPKILRTTMTSPPPSPTTKRSISKTFEVPERKRNSLTIDSRSKSTSNTGTFTKSRTESSISKSELQSTPLIEGMKSEMIPFSTNTTENSTSTNIVKRRFERSKISKNKIIYETADVVENKYDEPARDKAPVKDYGDVYRKYFGLLSSYRDNNCLDPIDNWHSEPLPVKEFKRQLRRRSLLNGWPDKTKFNLVCFENDSTFIENQRKMHEETVATIKEKHGENVASLIDEDLPIYFSHIRNHWLKDDDDDAQDDSKFIDDVLFSKIDSLTDSVEHLKEKLGLEKTPPHPEIYNAAERETKSKKNITAKKKKAREAVAASKRAFLKTLNGEQ